MQLVVSQSNFHKLINKKVLVLSLRGRTVGKAPNAISQVATKRVALVSCLNPEKEGEVQCALTTLIGTQGTFLSTVYKIYITIPNILIVKQTLK